MKSKNVSFSRLLMGGLLAVTCMAYGGAALAQNNGAMTAKPATTDKRKLTTVQSATLKGNKSVMVRYLDLPWGATTFGYIENGGSQYYSTRTWPVAHLTLGAKAEYEGKTLEPGDYIMVITPKSGENSMMLSISSFKPEGGKGTFLTPGNVFTDTPKGAMEIVKKPIAFSKGAPMIDTMKIMVEQEKDKMVAVKFHYGDRMLVEKFKLL